MAWVTPSNVATGDVLTASTWNQDVVANIIALPRGIVATSELISNLPMTATVADTGLSVTFTAESSRQYKFSFFGVHDASAAGNVIQFFITDSANVAQKEVTTTTTGIGYIMNSSTAVILSGISGSVTYKVRFALSAGTGFLYGGTTRQALKAQLLVEDVGAV
jgi:hypothetical protein